MFFPTSPDFRKIDLSNGIKSKAMINLANKEFYVFIMKFSLALLALIFGCIFIWKGIESDAVIKFTYNGAVLELNKALPGITLAFISLLLMLFSRLNVRM